MADGDTFDARLFPMSDNPGLGIGIHLALIEKRSLLSVEAEAYP